MKKLLMIAFVTMALTSCSNNGGESGAVNDGINAVDSNGGLPDTVNRNNGPAIDTNLMDNRVDLSTRDTFDKDKK
jgi:hypothetical protein